MNAACQSCPKAADAQWNLDAEQFDSVVALAGNPNTGKSTIFNALTGLRQHTGNWPGKTVTRAEGRFSYADADYKLVDLPGTYSLLSMSEDERIAQDFLVFGQPDVTIMVADANRLERNLNLILQVLEITDSVVICLNLIDEAERHGVRVDDGRLADELGVPVVPTVAHRRQGISRLIQTVHAVATGTLTTHPRGIPFELNGSHVKIEQLERQLEQAFPGLPNARWVAVRLLDGDERIIQAVRRRTLERVRPEARHGDRARRNAAAPSSD